jgi:hypothetical protein
MRVHSYPYNTNGLSDAVTGTARIRTAPEERGYAQGEINGHFLPQVCFFFVFVDKISSNSGMPLLSGV